MAILHDKTILIVDDSMTNMAVYNMVLRKSGARVLQDFRNTDTVNLLLRNPVIDLVLMDLVLHYGVSGYDVFDKIKAQPALAHIPIIVITAADPAVEIPKAQAKGFAGLIAKPIDPLSFPQQLADIIKGVPVWHAQPTSSLGNLNWSALR